MDRELVLAVLVALGCGSALTAAGWCPTGLPVASSRRALERQAWVRLWLPFAPAVFLFAALCGWALVEPERSERVPNYLLCAALPFVALLARAVWRAARSLRTSDCDLAVATVGLFRPRVILSPRLVEALDERALAAALEHERVHVRHRDPLRLWLAQLGSDLLWPWPMAESRLRCWTRALELARDEEARVSGIAGPDLAAAILVSLRLSRGSVAWSAATLGGDASFLRERIACLMRPLETEASPANTSALWLLTLAMGMTLAVVVGTAFGESVVQTFLAVV